MFYKTLCAGLQELGYRDGIATLHPDSKPLGPYLKGLRIKRRFENALRLVPFYIAELKLQRGG